MRVRRIGWLLLALLIVQGSANAASPGGEIAFVSERNGRYQIYLMNADGSNIRQLTHAAFGASVPIWSPDGKKLLYELGRDSTHTSLAVMDADGAHSVILAPEFIDPDMFCAWSPDSQSIIYPVEKGPDSAITIEFHRINADGTGDQRLDFGATDRPVERVSYFPDGKSLFVVEIQGVYTADLDGSHLRLLNAQLDDPAALSPDGQHIVGYNYTRIKMIETDADGTNPKVLFPQLTSAPRADLSFYNMGWLGWSPSGLYLWGSFVFYPDLGTATPDLNTEANDALFIGTTNGEDYWLRTPVQEQINWSPDSQWIAYTIKTDDGHEQIAISTPIGGSEMQLTHDNSNFRPAWRPTPAT